MGLLDYFRTSRSFGFEIGCRFLLSYRLFESKAKRGEESTCFLGGSAQREAMTTQGERFFKRDNLRRKKEVGDSFLRIK